MNRDFEIRQLLRAYRSGILSEAAFEKELRDLERGASGEGGDDSGFEAFGQRYWPYPFRYPTQKLVAAGF